MLNDLLSIAMLLAGFILLAVGLIVRKIANNAKRMAWRPGTCSESCSAEVRHRNRKEWDRYYSQLTE